MKAERIKEVCRLLGNNDLEGARSYLIKYCPSEDTAPSENIPRNPKLNSQPKSSDTKVTERKYSDADATKLFIRDGFVDRYSGEFLIYPGVLRLISHLCPAEFAYHPNWKIPPCHSWYWELFPSVDHVVPITYAGADEADNWVSTSFVRNLLKSNNPLEKMGWEMHPPGDVREWDGMMGWFVNYYEKHPDLKKEPPLRQWYRAAKSALKEIPH